MKENPPHIVMIGLGNIGQALLPLLKKHLPDHGVYAFEKTLTPQIRGLAEKYGITLFGERITRHNYISELRPLLLPGSYLLNLATSVSTCDLIRLAQSRGAHYLDTCIDPWEYDHTGQGISTSNYFLREQVRDLRDQAAGMPTALVAHGANPGFVSVLLKKGLLDMAASGGLTVHTPTSREAWAELARRLDVRVVQISERDTQVAAQARGQGEFVCTWSVDGLVTECLQPAELGWGSHETMVPENGVTHAQGCQAAIMLDQPSFTVKVKSWSPNYLDFDAYLITHNEAISIADYFTLRGERGQLLYRPTAYYAYHPCDDAVASFSLLGHGNVSSIEKTRVLKEEITSGIDELGVFIISATYPSLWIGSNLSIGKARKTAENNNATSLQVVSSVVAAMLWIKENPRVGVIESEDLDHDFIFFHTAPYWSPIVSQQIRWRPHSDCTAYYFQDFLSAPTTSPAPKQPTTSPAPKQPSLRPHRISQAPI